VCSAGPKEVGVVSPVSKGEKTRGLPVNGLGIYADLDKRRGPILRNAPPDAVTARRESGEKNENESYLVATGKSAEEGPSGKAADWQRGTTARLKAMKNV